MRVSNSRRSRVRARLLVATMMMLVGLEAAVVAVSADTTQFPDWLEPRGISIVELVGQVPDEYLQGTILSYGDGDGIVVYRSGTRVGNTVTVTATLYPRLVYPPWGNGLPLTQFGCLGQTPHFDHMGTMVPQSTLRVWDANNQEVTQQIYDMWVTHMGTLQPLGGSTLPFRYPEDAYGPVPGMLPLSLGPKGLAVPPNSGCRIEILGHDYRVLTGVFTMQFEPAVHATVLGLQQTTFQSYIGVGGVGIFQPLMSQLRDRFPDRHGRIPLAVPQGADYFLLKFPPMPGDPYTDHSLPYLNADRPSGGTYRLSKNIKELSTDTTFTAIFPTDVAWKDSDQARGTEFLPVMRDLTDLAPPEYVLPVGVPYNSCYTEGTCSDTVLNRIYQAQMSMDIVYLHISKLVTTGQWVPVKLAGPAWSPAAAMEFSVPETQLSAMPALLLAPEVPTATHTIRLPYISRDISEPEPTGCPCGYFDALGRMLDFRPGEAVILEK